MQHGRVVETRPGLPRMHDSSGPEAYNPLPGKLLRVRYVVLQVEPLPPPSDRCGLAA